MANLLLGTPSRTGRSSPWSRRRRDRRLWIALLIGICVAAVACWFAVGRLVFGVQGPCDSTLLALSRKQVARLQIFAGWLARNHVQGYVGEVGWPGVGGNAEQWNAIGNAWFQAADRDHLWVTTWSAAEGWPANYPMAVYRLHADPEIGSTAGSQASVVEAHAATGSGLRGVDLPSGAFGTIHDASGRYSDLRPGRYGIDYYYPNAPEYRFLAAHGVRLVRLAFTWERLQPRLDGPLDPAALHQLKQTVYDASAAGLAVVLDLHNFGAYWHASEPPQSPTRWTLGSTQLPTSAFANFWQRMAVAFRGVPAVTAFDLMNEPTDLAPTPAASAAIWEQASQGAVDAIRATGDVRTVVVSGDGSASPEVFGRLQPKAWIHDPADAVRYEMHQYFDSNSTGLYRRSLPQEAAAARAIERRDPKAFAAANYLTCIHL